MTAHIGIVAMGRCWKWATTKLLDCLIVVRLIGYGLARKDSEDLDWFGPEMPYVQYGGGVLALLLSSLGAQSSEWSL